MEKRHPAINRIDLAVITTICFGLFVVSSIDSVLNGLPAYQITNDALGATIVTEIGMAVFALAYLRVRGHHLHGLIPAPTLRGTVAGGWLYLLVLALASAVQSLMALGMPALREHADIIQVAASPTMILAMSMVNAVYEEAFLLGFLQAALARTERHFAVGAVLLLRLSYHLYQGPVGVAFAAIFGAVIGYYYLRTRKLWPAVAAHIIADVVALSAG